MNRPFSLLLVLTSCAAAAAGLLGCADDPSVASASDSLSAADSQDKTDPSRDPPITLSNLADTVANHMCKALARSCFGNSNPPDGAANGGSFDRAECQKVYMPFGFEGSNDGSFAFSGGKVTLDKAKATECVARMDDLAFAPTGLSLREARAACLAAVKGTVHSGAECAHSVECAEGLFCRPRANTGLAGTCEPLRRQGEHCGLFGDRVELADAVCAHVGSSGAPLRCSSIDFVLGEIKDPKTWTCESLVDNGQMCASSVWCRDGICDDSFVCKPRAPYFNPFVCDLFVKR